MSDKSNKEFWLEKCRELEPDPRKCPKCAARFVERWNFAQMED